MACRVRGWGLAALAALMLLLPAAATHGDLLLEDGDHMVFLGDSITQQRIYTRYVMNYFALRYPDMEVTFRNAGVGGDTAVGAIKRLDDDVLSRNPDVVSICFGMNDAGYGEFDQERYERYIAGMTVLLSELEKAKVVLLTPGPVDPDKAAAWLNGDVYNGVLARYAEGVKELAAQRGVPVHDIYELLSDVQTRAKADDPEFTMIPDAIHPSPPGQALMAYALLKTLGCDEAASGLEIDAEEATFAADRCAVYGLEVSDAEVSFRRRDEALPTYFDPEVDAVFDYAPIVDDLNQYRLRLTGLQAGSWQLTVEAMDVGTFDAGALAEGVNLATYPGPWQELGEAVNDLVSDQEDIYLQKRRLMGMFVWVSTPPPEAEAEKQALIDRLEEIIADRERTVSDLVDARTWEWRLTHVQ